MNKITLNPINFLLFLLALLPIIDLPSIFQLLFQALLNPYQVNLLEVYYFIFVPFQFIFTIFIIRNPQLLNFLNLIHPIFSINLFLFLFFNFYWYIKKYYSIYLFKSYGSNNYFSDLWNIEETNPRLFRIWSNKS